MSEAGNRVAKIRIRQSNNQPVAPDGQYVLYWMTAFRRPYYNFALQRAVEQATLLRKPLLIFEALLCDSPYASNRLHHFALNGIADNAESFSSRPVSYYPFVETQKGQAQSLLKELSASACLVVSDDHPSTYLKEVLQTAARTIAVHMEAVDSNGLLPLLAADKDYPTAYAFRRFLQKTLPGHLFDFPRQDPLKGIELPELEGLPDSARKRWPPASSEEIAAGSSTLALLPIDHSVTPTDERGGWKEAEFYLQRFLDERLCNYLQRSEPEMSVSSELSPYLHFGYISSHQIFSQLVAQEHWSIGNLGPETKGKRSGWWGMSEAAEAFLDQLITWREVGFNAALFRPNYDQYHSLPDWARESLDKHRDDPRPYLYSLEQFELAKTHDPLWNAAQNQLRIEGRLHNYLRMLWGKKILEWSIDAETALKTMLTLNDKYALDGRDPNSVSGIFWCLGRYDRAWGPERPIFGKIRYMTSQNTARKYSVKNYLQRFTPTRE